MSNYKYTPDATWAKTKADDSKVYNLNDPAQRKLYFNDKVGDEIVKLQEYFKNNSFIAYLLAPKNAGKGTYTKMLAEIFPNSFVHISVGDLVREVHGDYEANGKESEAYKYAIKHYRGFLDLDKAFDALVNRTTDKVSVPTELVMTFIKMAIDKAGRKTIFLDGFPRTADQIQYSLYMRDLVNYREDPDCFITIHLPLAIIDDRIKTRVICPNCSTSRNFKTLPTTDVRWDETEEKFYLYCDNPDCEPTKMVGKEGDEKGIENIMGRVNDDLDLIMKANELYGIPKIALYNSFEKDKAGDLFDDYEITSEFYYEKEGDKVETKTRPYSVHENGVEYASLMPAPVVVQLIRQLVNTFIPE